MADASLSFGTPSIVDGANFPFLQTLTSRNPKIFKNRVITAPTTAAEIRTGFTNAIESRTQVTITCTDAGTDEQYMTITAGGTTYSLWIDTANDDTAVATMSGTKLSIQHNDTPNAATVATRGATLLDAQAEIVAWAEAAVIYAIGTDKTDPITAAANVDGPFTVSAITSGVSCAIVSASASDVQTGTLVYIDEDGDEATQTFTMTGTTPVNFTGTPRAINAVILNSVAVGAITVTEYGAATALVFATVAAGDYCTINCRYYVPDGRKSYMKVVANIRDTSDNTALVEANGFNIEALASNTASVPDDSVYTDTATVHKNAQFEVEMDGADNEYLGVNLGEVDLDGTAFLGGVVIQTIITWDE